MMAHAIDNPAPTTIMLISGDRDAIHRAGMSVQGRTVSELDVSEDDWDQYVIEDLS